ncbi:acyl-CoA dehydrogenase family protein [Cryptosporangium aurantiacum]|uniref:Acyl-CoA dehydrogenase n=1 Tax=Cryptosporangium aurantiacum TaxID=134849 RepID=A0A1M7PNG0_9ACTN|nr:acyl-CoA dehydrogenase family protein [Cryptosporangium aurantiacum]SHN18797.1 Acyl-CoA dehydrogenase [Cryptosporangium aurantiacum]
MTPYRAEVRQVVDDVLAPHFGSGTPPETLWTTVSGLGWPFVGVPESAGGSGGDLADGAEIAAGVGRHACALPLVRTGLAGWTLARLGRPIDVVRDGVAMAVAGRGRLTVRPASHGWELSGAVPAVSWLPGAPLLVVATVEVDAAPWTAVTLLDADRVRASVAGGADLAGAPRGRLSFDRVSVTDLMLGPADLLRAVADRGAILRAAAIGGALERACMLLTEHVAVRHQFGRPLRAFQSVAHRTADALLERDLALAAVASAIATADGPSVAARSATAAAARAVTARAAGVVAEIAHQLHGAIGITQEHPLHLVTRRLWAWRDEDGSQRHWERRLGSATLRGEDDVALWALTTTGAQL